MNFQFRRHFVLIFIACVVVVVPTRIAHAQEAEVVTTIGKEIVDALGKDAVEFGGDTAARQTANRLVTEATESVGNTGGRIAKAQVERILASGRESLIFDLKSLSGKSLLLLEDVTDEALPSAVGTLARPGVGEAIGSLSSITLQKAALAGETRLPGVGLKLVQHYGVEGTQLATDLTEDQANSVIAALRPNAINSLSSAERSKLLNALSSRADARVFNFQGITGPLVVVASGVVLWHGIDVTLSPDERVTELPDGTVIREKTSVGSRAVEVMPAAVRELSTPLRWTGVTLALGAIMISGILLLMRRRERMKRRESKVLKSEADRRSGVIDKTTSLMK